MRSISVCPWHVSLIRLCGIKSGQLSPVQCIFDVSLRAKGCKKEVFGVLGSPRSKWSRARSSKRLIQLHVFFVEEHLTEPACFGVNSFRKIDLQGTPSTRPNRSIAA